MLRRVLPLLGGVLIGLLSTAVLQLLIAEPRGHPIELLPPATPKPMRVHVAGAVVSPGLIELPLDAVVADAITAAGGPSAQAALDAINLAAAIHDGDRVYLPTVAEVAAGTIPTPSQAEVVDDGRLALNSATVPELERLPGIGPSLAEAIAAYRQEHGPFQQVEDLLAVPGIGPAKLEAIRDLVVVP